MLLVFIETTESVSLNWSRLCPRTLDEGFLEAILFRLQGSAIVVTTSTIASATSPVLALFATLLVSLMKADLEAERPRAAFLDRPFLNSLSLARAVMSTASSSVNFLFIDLPSVCATCF